MTDIMTRLRDERVVREILETYIDLSEDERGEVLPVCDDIDALQAKIVDLLEEARSKT